MFTQDCKDTTEAPPTRDAQTEPVDVTKSVNPTVVRNLARMAGKKGGSSKRQVAVMGLGLAPEEMPEIDLRSSDSQLAILEAVVRALALGKTSGLVATSIVQAVKAAGVILATDQQAQLDELTRQVEQLVASRVIPRR